MSQYGEIADVNLHGWNCALCGRHVIGPTVAGSMCAECEERSFKPRSGVVFPYEQVQP